MLRGARVKRKNEWLHTALMCATMEDIVNGISQIMGANNVQPANPENYMPIIFRDTPAVESRDVAQDRFAAAVQNMHDLIDRRNIERAKKGLPPLPYKKL